MFNRVIRELARRKTSMVIAPTLRNWIKGTDFDQMKKNKKQNDIEYEMIRECYNTQSRKQWTNEFGEDVVRHVLALLGHDVYPKRPVFTHDGQTYVLDIETDKCLVEVKTRNWTTSGTAGEKIAGVPFKYRYVSNESKKPVLIVLVGYQEYEAVHKFGLFKDDEVTLMHTKLWKSLGFEFVKLSDLLDEIDNQEN